ncbi:arylsulfatase A-like enzyme [Halohasta litchfieldiae]|nr:arylsulfatase A-like enzyme [Halohasta litchfieldiae]
MVSATEHRDMSASRPNVLLLLTDQERADLVAPDGLPVDTPNIDRLREEGMWFESAYTPTSICTSARASLLTGLYSHAHGLLNNSHEADAIRTDLPEELPTLGELLAESGYTNTYLGKWHVSHNHTPGDFGFRYFGGSDYHHDNFDVAFEHFRESQGIRVPEVDVEDKIYAGEGDDTTLIAGTDPVPVEASRPYFLAERTINALERWVDDDRQPCFHRTDFLGPHHPYVVPEPYASMYEPTEIEPWSNYAETFESKPRVHEQYLHYRGVEGFEWETWAEAIAKYFGFMTLIDDQIGRILDALDDLGMADKTAVVHTSDHGDLTGSHRLFNKGPMMYDETYRIPLVVRWPGVVDPGSQSTDFVRLHDLMPTFLDWAGIEPPEGIHARSIQPLLMGDLPDDWPASTYAQYHGDEFGLYSQRMVRTEEYKFIYNGPDRNELYDLTADPHELRNLADHPAYADVQREMEGRLVDWMDEVDDSLRRWVPKTLQ